MILGAGLSFDQAPPPAVPFRFLLAAPWFLFLAGGLLLFADPAAGRWSPAWLALTHLVTLGALGSAMLGALHQLLPVAVGAHVPHGALLSRWGFPVYATGVLLLAGGFLVARPMPLAVGAALLAIVLAAKAAAFGLALVRAPGGKAPALGMKLALAALAVTVLFGLVLAAGHVAGRGGMLHGTMTGLHAAWGGFGWVGLLIVAVSLQVVPLFHVTPELPRPIAWAVPVACIAGLALMTAGGWPAWRGPGADALGILGAALLAAAFVVWAVVLWRALGRSRRRVRDTSAWYWRLGTASVLMLVAGFVAERVGFVREFPPLAAGVLLFAGFALSVVSGMLIKIVPFLVWLHLQNRATDGGRFDYLPPNMSELVPARRTRVQFALQALALALTMAATLSPGLGLHRVAGAAWLAAAGLLGVLLLGALRRFRAETRALGD